MDNINDTKRIMHRVEQVGLRRVQELLSINISYSDQLSDSAKELRPTFLTYRLCHCVTFRDFLLASFMIT
jgi:hypothetical protein